MTIVLYQKWKLDLQEIKEQTELVYQKIFYIDLFEEGISHENLWTEKRN
jgi:hypothetical protein